MQEITTGTNQPVRIDTSPFLCYAYLMLKSNFLWIWNGFNKAYHMINSAHGFGSSLALFIRPSRGCSTTIYLSSNCADLKEYRKVVLGDFRKAGYQVIAMEDYVAAGGQAVDKDLGFRHALSAPVTIPDDQGNQ